MGASVRFLRNVDETPEPHENTNAYIFMSPQSSIVFFALFRCPGKECPNIIIPSLQPLPENC